jgi:uncharacterized membrane protein
MLVVGAVPWLQVVLGLVRVGLVVAVLGPVLRLLCQPIILQVAPDQLILAAVVVAVGVLGLIQALGQPAAPALSSSKQKLNRTSKYFNNLKLGYALLGCLQLTILW